MAFDYVLVSSILQSKTSAEAHCDPIVTEAATSLSACYIEQHIFHSLLPAGQHVKIRLISYCAGLHRSAVFILTYVYRAKTCVLYDACEQCGVCADD